MLLAFIVDVVVWHKAKSVSFNEDEEGQEEATLMNPPSLSQSPSTPPVVIEPTPTTSTAVEISPFCLQPWLVFILFEQQVSRMQYGWYSRKNEDN